MSDFHINRIHIDGPWCSIRSRPIGEDGTVIEMDMHALLMRIGETTRRPRYAFLVLNLIAKGADAEGSCGPFIEHRGNIMTVRSWLAEMLHPIVRHAARRRPEGNAELVNELDVVRSSDQGRCDVQERRPGLTNISTAVSDLVRAGLLSRYYAGYRVDHLHRGGQRHAVYRVAPEVRAALAGSPGQDRAAA